MSRDFTGSAMCAGYPLAGADQRVPGLFAHERQTSADTYGTSRLQPWLRPGKARPQQAQQLIPFPAAPTRRLS
jgi:hypothetical protein